MKAITIWPSYFGHLESAQEYLVTMVLLCFYENHCFEVYVFWNLTIVILYKIVHYQELYFGNPGEINFGSR